MHLKVKAKGKIVLRYHLPAAALFMLAAGYCSAADRDTAVALAASAEKSIKASDVNTAKSMAERALASDSTCPQAHYQMGQALELLNQPREAIRSYQLASDYAKKEGNGILMSKALDAAKKLGPGLLELAQADLKLAEKFFTLGEKALADEQLDTAKAAFASALALSPSHAKARENMKKATAAIEARGDPVQGKIAAAMLAEVWYHWGNGNKDNARKLAGDLSGRFGKTASGKEAASLLAQNFDLSKKLGTELAVARAALLEQQRKQAKPAASTPVRTPVTSATTPATAKAAVSANRVDVEALEKSATEEIQKLPKERLVSEFASHFTKGKEFYAKAVPGAEGNQKNLASALEQFLYCEAAYLRLDDLKMVTPEIEANQQQASMSRYACMKMTILAH